MKFEFPQGPSQDVADTIQRLQQLLPAAAAASNSHAPLQAPQLTQLVESLPSSEQSALSGFRLKVDAALKDWQAAEGAVQAVTEVLFVLVLIPECARNSDNSIRCNTMPKISLTI